MPGTAAIVIGGSAGAIQVLTQLLVALPVDGPPVLIVVHLPPSTPSRLAQVFRPHCARQLHEAESSVQIERGAVYFAPAGYHLLIEPDQRCALSLEAPVHFSRPSIDVLFESAADVYGRSLIGVVLSGANQDGAQGLRAIQEAHGLTLVQDPATAEMPFMPRAALAAVPSARALSVAGLCETLAAGQVLS